MERKLKNDDLGRLAQEGKFSPIVDGSPNLDDLTLVGSDIEVLTTYGATERYQLIGTETVHGKLCLVGEHSWGGRHMFNTAAPDDYHFAWRPVAVLYDWQDVEHPLATPVVTARRLTIDTFTSGDGGVRFTATGFLWATDYAEGCKFGDPWDAQGAPAESDTYAWTIGKRPTSHDPTDWFTGNRQINNAIEHFIAHHLEDYRKFPACVAGKKVTVGLRRYEGPHVEYDGPCICHELVASGHNVPFVYERYTKGKFPAYCFRCSCGTAWWCGNPKEHLWVRVPDAEAFAMLLKYNGVPIRPISVIDEGLFLVETLRHQGLIPIG